MGNARVDIDTAIPPEVHKQLKENEQEIANMIEAEAKASTSFKDITGKLRNSIKAKKKDDGWIVEARVPYAFVVEFGHGGPNPAPQKSYLRVAKEKVISKI